MRMRNNAFTLIELLVVIAIVGALASLLLPAIQTARESSRSAQCTSRMRQLGLALHAHHDTEGAFPPGFDNGWSWHSKLLPQLEKSNVFQQFDFNRAPLQEPNIARLDANVPVFLCLFAPPVQGQLGPPFQLS